MNEEPDIIAFGESGWLARPSGFASTLDSGLFANRVADILRFYRGIKDAVAGIDSLVLRFDPAMIDATAARDLLAEALRSTRRDSPDSNLPIIEIPVCYGGNFGPDTDRVCGKCSLTDDELFTRHSRVVYRVVTLGFEPGFAYLSALDPSLQIARLATPRVSVPAGSVGIAGTFTGIYPLASPGGWNIIGRSPKKLFNPASERPFVLGPGSSIRFVPISETEFHQYQDAS